MNQSYELINEELKSLDDFLSAEVDEQFSDMVNLNELLGRVDKSSYVRKSYYNEMKESIAKEELSNEKKHDLSDEKEKESDVDDKKVLVDKIETLLNMI